MENPALQRNCEQLFDEGNDTLEVNDHERYIDSCVRVQRISSATEVALKWYTNGFWRYVSNSEDGDFWATGKNAKTDESYLWPPTWVAETVDRNWFVPEWLESMHDLSLLSDPVHQRERYLFGPSSTSMLPPLLTQLDSVWIGLLTYAASLIGISDDRLAALTELSQSCGAVYLDSNHCVLSERPV